MLVVFLVLLSDEVDDVKEFGVVLGFCGVTGADIDVSDLSGGVGGVVGQLALAIFLESEREVDRLVVTIGLLLVALVALLDSVATALVLSLVSVAFLLSRTEAPPVLVDLPEDARELRLLLLNKFNFSPARVSRARSCVVWHRYCL